jgi:hypothetical protein
MKSAKPAEILKIKNFIKISYFAQQLSSILPAFMWQLFGPFADSCGKTAWQGTGMSSVER